MTRLDTRAQCSTLRAVRTWDEVDGYEHGLPRNHATKLVAMVAVLVVLVGIAVGMFVYNSVHTHSTPPSTTVCGLACQITHDTLAP